jgi:hypothetical protein
MRPLEKLRIWEGYSKTSLKKIGWEEVQLTDLAQRQIVGFGTCGTKSLFSGS